MFSFNLDKCTRCKRDAIPSFKYCCNTDDRLCFYCADKKCPKCHEQPSNIFKRIRPKEEVCYKCLSKNTTSYQDEFFYENKSQTFYCFPCLLGLYKQFCRLVSMLPKQRLSPPLKLDKDIQIHHKTVISFLQKYCFVCHEKTYGRGIKLKNECLVMYICFTQLKNLVENFLASIQEKKIYEELDALVNRCCICQKIMYGDQTGSKEEDGVIFCSSCITVSSLSESLSKPEWEKNKEEKQQSLKRSRMESKEQRKMDKESSEKKKPHLVNASRYFLYHCQLCNEGISTKIQGQNICFSCYGKTFSQPEEFPLVDIDLRSQKQDDRIDKDRKKQVKMRPEKDQVEHLRLEQKIEEKSKKQEQVKSTPKKQKLTILQKKKEAEEVAQYKLKGENDPKPNKQEIEPSKDLPLQQKVSIHEQFLPLDPISLQIEIIEKKVSQCIKCGYFVSQGDTFRSYLRQIKNDKVLRIVQTANQLQKYEKEGKISTYCKQCYYQQKENHQKEAKRKKQQVVQDRIFKSLPKKEKYTERTELLGTYTESKRYKDMIRPSQSQPDFFCLSCYGRVVFDQFNFVDRICNKCDKHKQQKAKVKRQSPKLCKLCNDPMNERPYTQYQLICDKCYLNPSHRLI